MNSYTGNYPQQEYLRRIFREIWHSEVANLRSSPTQLAGVLCSISGGSLFLKQDLKADKAAKKCKLHRRCCPQRSSPGWGNRANGGPQGSPGPPGGHQGPEGGPLYNILKQKKSPKFRPASRPKIPTLDLANGGPESFRDL